LTWGNLNASADVKSDLGWFVYEIGANEGTSMTQNLFSNEEFKQVIFGDDYATLFQGFNAHITVPKPAHDGLMTTFHGLAGEAFMTSLLDENALGCPG